MKRVKGAIKASYKPPKMPKVKVPPISIKPHIKKMKTK